jgi:hypothetical protein
VPESLGDFPQKRLLDGLMSFDPSFSQAFFSFKFIALGVDKHMIVGDVADDPIDIMGVYAGYKFQNHDFIHQRPPEWVKIYVFMRKIYPS